MTPKYDSDKCLTCDKEPQENSLFCVDCDPEKEATRYPSEDSITKWPSNRVLMKRVFDRVPKGLEAKCDNCHAEYVTLGGEGEELTPYPMPGTWWPTDLINKNMNRMAWIMRCTNCSNTFLFEIKKQISTKGLRQLAALKEQN